ncbi:MAG: ABC transporter ATP-binding protein [Chloroflexi bacterium]|nr:ABC transporter ATP-binding protein [Chloroflexota bacterium]
MTENARTAAPLLEARNVTKVFGGGLMDRTKTTALADFSLTIANSPPSITAIVGESGSGKTTLARLLLGLVEPTTGQVLYDGTDVQKLSKQGWKEYLRQVQVIFQDPYEVYNPFYKVDTVLETPVRKFGLASSKAQARDLVEETLQAVGLRPEETLGRYPHQLSGGQRQRIMVARALIVRPRIIIADEPVSMVDASLRATILASLVKLNRDFGISLVYITHDLTTAYQVSENIVVLYRGTVAEAGSVEQVVRGPRHPYTQLLVGSVPRADPRHPWLGEEEASREAARASTQSCAFASRCPHALPACIEQHPPLYQPDPHCIVACYLHRESPVIERDALSRAFVQAAPTRV